jgi:hypothetical protein
VGRTAQFLALTLDRGERPATLLGKQLTVSQYHSTTVPQHHCTTVPLYHCTTYRRLVELQFPSECCREGRIPLPPPGSKTQLFSHPTCTLVAILMPLLAITIYAALSPCKRSDTFLTGASTRGAIVETLHHALQISVVHEATSRGWKHKHKCQEK